MKIISLINPHSGCDYHRVKLPITYLHSAGLIHGVQADTFESSLEQCDILFYNRMPYGRHLPQITEMRRWHGFKIVVDVDDYWRLYPGHYLEPMWRRNGYSRMIIENISEADAVTTTNERLADKIRKYNPNVFVIPNGLPIGDGQFTAERMPYERMRFSYVGGGSHYWDVRLLAAAAEKLARTAFSGELILAGTAPGVAIYDKMIRTMSAAGKLKAFRHLHYLPLDSYMNLYNDADVALAPLVPGEFNACKSNLKVIEAGCKAMPIIVSNTGPYRDDDNPLIMRVDQPSEWYGWIKYCESNPEFVRETGAAMHEYVKQNYDLRILNFLRMEVFESVLKK